MSGIGETSDQGLVSTAEIRKGPPLRPDWIEHDDFKEDHSGLLSRIMKRFGLVGLALAIMGWLTNSMLTQGEKLTWPAGISTVACLIVIASFTIFVTRNGATTASEGNGSTKSQD